MKLSRLVLIIAVLGAQPTLADAYTTVTKPYTIAWVCGTPSDGGVLYVYGSRESGQSFRAENDSSGYKTIHGSFSSGDRGLYVYNVKKGDLTYIPSRDDESINKGHYRMESEQGELVDHGQGHYGSEKFDYEFNFYRPTYNPWVQAGNFFAEITDRTGPFNAGNKSECRVLDIGSDGKPQFPLGYPSHGIPLTFSK